MPKLRCLRTEVLSFSLGETALECLEVSTPLRSSSNSSEVRLRAPRIGETNEVGGVAKASPVMLADSASFIGFFSGVLGSGKSGIGTSMSFGCRG